MTAKPKNQMEEEEPNYIQVSTPTNKEQTKQNDDKQQQKKQNGDMSFLRLYAFATTFDKVLLVMGVIFSIINGALFPMLAILFSDAIESVAVAPIDISAVNQASLNFFFVALGLLVCGFVSYYCFEVSAERQMNALRSAVIKHVLYQEMAWYDQTNAAELASRVSGDTVKIKEGMGEKLGELLKVTAQFVVGYIIGFYRGYNMSLAMSAIMPAMALSLAYLITKMKAHAIWAQKVYAEAGSVAEEAFSSIKTVASLNGEEKAADLYQKKVINVEKENLHLQKFVSMAFGWFRGSIWIMYAVGLWYGGYLVSSQSGPVKTPTEVLASFYAILIGTIALAQISPNISAIATGKGAAIAIYEILDRQSVIDASNNLEEDVIELEENFQCTGKVEARNVNFSYPSRPDVQVLSDYNLVINSGETVALVGASGGGKSTLVALLERFYDPSNGCILLDNRDLRSFPVQYIRSQIGLVSQEPVLFSGTIFENIASGLPSSSTAGLEQVQKAAKLSNAHDFIMTLPEKYETMVGERGAALSGGQKQRIAIARALIREPKILILDEATSALDSESERIVQEALNDLMISSNSKMTTIVIAHRLSTIRNADQIVVISEGCVMEKGSHDELIGIDKGLYRTLVELQEGAPREGTSPSEQYLERLSVAMDESVVMNQLVRTYSHQSDRNMKQAAQKNQKMEKSDDKEVDVSFSRIFGLNKSDRKFLILGMFAAAVNGFALPTSSVLISEIIIKMNEYYAKYVASGLTSHLDTLYDEVELYGIFYLAGSLLICAITFTQSYSFKYMGEKMVTKLRDMNFRGLLRQEMGFFDRKENSTGSLTSDLASNATKVIIIAGENQGRLVECFFTFVAALLISFTLGSWLLSLVMLAVFPVLIVATVLRTLIFKRGMGNGLEAMAEAGACASEAISNIRTVVAYGMESKISKKYEGCLIPVAEKAKKEARWNAFANGFSTFVMFAAYALVFWYGGRLVRDQDITFGELMRTLMAIMMSAQGIGQAAGFMGDSNSAKEAAQKIFSIVDRQPEIDSFSTAGGKIEGIEGKLQFDQVKFSYPTRPDSIILENYNLTIEAGETVALCGPSGGGKSTVVSLLERFYNPCDGRVLLDGVDIQDLNIRWVREQIGMVGQEPVLFAGTIAENIAHTTELASLGGEGEKNGMKRREEILEQVYNAAKMANAHDFVSNFPDGYDTQVGLKGTQLSGGQKQRIAIARAIFHDPRILLLDEATSALDSESERIVQEALDNLIAMKKRTTIIIAHRLSTIRNADKICVVSGGRVAEEGTHSALLEKGGIYSKLVNKMH